MLLYLFQCPLETTFEISQSWEEPSLLAVYLFVLFEKWFEETSEKTWTVGQTTYKNVPKGNHIHI